MSVDTASHLYVVAFTLYVACRNPPPCSPCPVHTFWHIASLNLKELFGTRWGFPICPHKFCPFQNSPFLAPAPSRLILGHVRTAFSCHSTASGQPFSCQSTASALPVHRQPTLSKQKTLVLDIKGETLRTETGETRTLPSQCYRRGNHSGERRLGWCSPPGILEVIEELLFAEGCGHNDDLQAGLWSAEAHTQPRQQQIAFQHSLVNLQSVTCGKSPFGVCCWRSCHDSWLAWLLQGSPPLTKDSPNVLFRPVWSMVSVYCGPKL